MKTHLYCLWLVVVLVIVLRTPPELLPEYLRSTTVFEEEQTQLVPLTAMMMASCSPNMTSVSKAMEYLKQANLVPCNQTGLAFRLFPGLEISTNVSIEQTPVFRFESMGNLEVTTKQIEQRKYACYLDGANAFIKLTHSCWSSVYGNLTEPHSVVCSTQPTSILLDQLTVQFLL
jgi:hypothetical protein